MVAAGPLSRSIETIQKMAGCGASAVVLWSLFEEQIEHEARQLEHYLQYGTERFAESLTYFPQAHEFHFAPEQYLEHIAKAKQAVGIPIIASLNGISDSGWIDYAGKMAQAGADAIELNVYYIPALPQLTSQRVEEVYLDVLRAVKGSVSIPNRSCCALNGDRHAPVFRSIPVRIFSTNASPGATAFSCPPNASQKFTP